MCGIAGFVDNKISNEDGINRISKMISIIKHRGPDDEGVIKGLAVR